jgi:type-F conjugative transfer system pilin acetylase TraX
LFNANSHVAAPTLSFLRTALIPPHAAQIDILKFVAVIAMIIDHWNTALNASESDAAFLIGRIAFPIFGIVFALNLRADPARWRRAARRLFVAAVICQPLYTAAFWHVDFIPWYALNILFAFAVVAQAMYWWSLERLGLRVAAAILLATFAYPLASSSYGPTGLAFLMVSYACLYPQNRKIQVKWAESLWWVFVVVLNMGYPIIASAGALLSWLTIKLSTLFRRSQWSSVRYLPRNAFYWIYGGHLAVVAIARAV